MRSSAWTTALAKGPGNAIELLPCGFRNPLVGSQRLQSCPQFRQRRSIQRRLLQQIPQRFHRTRQLAGILREVSRIGIVQAAQRVLQIDDMVFVRDHPRRVLGGNHQVEVSEIEQRELLVATHDLPEIALRRRQLDQLQRMFRMAIDVGRQSPPEPFGAAGREWHRARGDQRDSHGPTEILASTPGICATPVKNASLLRTTSNTSAVSHQS